MFSNLNSEEIDSLLHKQVIGRIGCHADGMTYVIPISYVFDGDSVYAHSFKGLKIDIMRRNPKVCFQVDDTRNLANWQSVVCQGLYEEITDEPGMREALKKLNSRALPIINSQTMHLTPEWPFDAVDDEPVEGIFFRIKLLEKTGRSEIADNTYFFAT